MENKIIEGNKLIDEFMGLDPFIRDALRPDGNSFLNYNTSWSALMPVVEKIVKLYRHPGGERIYLHLLIWNPELILTPLKDLNINKIYNAVLEFINWYNTHPNGK